MAAIFLTIWNKLKQIVRGEHPHSVPYMYKLLESTIPYVGKNDDLFYVADNCIPVAIRSCAIVIAKFLNEIGEVNGVGLSAAAHIDDFDLWDLP